MLLPTLKNWAPFRLDALGLVTLLGTNELDIAIGRLVTNQFTEYLPLLGAYIVAGGDITKPIPGFELYNITDGIRASDITGWFARWLMCQKLTPSSSTITIRTTTSSHKQHRATRATVEIMSACIGILAITPIMIFAILMEDWWGFANAISMLISIIVRRIVVGQLRLAVQLAAEKSIDTSSEYVKTFWKMPDGTAVTINVTRGVVIDCLLTNPRPPNLRLYNWARVLGWAAFGCHVITLGMATLFSQLLSVPLLLISTVLVVRQIGDDDQHIRSSLVLRREDYKGSESFRAAVYSRMNLSEREEASMVSWNLMPHTSNSTWWKMYHDCKPKGDFTAWDQVLKKGYQSENGGENDNKVT